MAGEAAKAGPLVRWLRRGEAMDMIGCVDGYERIAVGAYSYGRFVCEVLRKPNTNLYIVTMRESPGAITIDRLEDALRGRWRTIPKEREILDDKPIVGRCQLCSEPYDADDLQEVEIMGRCPYCGHKFDEVR